MLNIKCTKTKVVVALISMILCITGCAEADYLRDVSDVYETYASSYGNYSPTGLFEPVVEEQEASVDTPEAVKQSDEVRQSLGLDSIDSVKNAMTNYYCYSVIDEDLRTLYAELYVIVMNEAEDVKISTASPDDLKYAFQCVYNDHPEIYWVEGYSYIRHELNGETQYLTFSGKYTYTMSQREEFDTQIQNYVDNCLSGISVAATQYEKVKYVYEYVIENTQYVDSAQDNQSILSVFLYGESVCQGYAKATEYLLRELGINSTVVTGIAYTGEGHAWNLVNVDGLYYYVDTTWGDSDYVIEGMNTDASMPINYDFLNITTEELEKTHSIDNIVPVPMCVATAANYYVKENIYFTSYDKNLMQSVFDNAYAGGKKVVTIKCANDAVFLSIQTALIDNQEIFSYLQESTSSVTYTISEDSLVFNFWI